ncbi:MAG: RNA polymerase sigma-70 factor [Mycobacterium sp.]|uniref:RNA polymerase sigma-70 factor n=1 Tax=Mycobacterium sp. TaxID=1785 RepID=UPI00389A4661
MTDLAAEFENHRPLLFGLAYRLLGSASEAEDAVQNTYLRLHGADRNAIRSLRAWLIKALTNLCLNELTSARVRRESYPGPWLPEGVFTADGALGPLETVEQRDSVSIALLTVMERLTSAERAAFVLREAFAYSHSDIADILDTSEANARQLHRRARQRLEEPKPRFRPDPAHWRALVERFLDAARGGDVNGLAAMLADQVSSTADGGGQVGAARRIVTGRDRVARYLAGGFRRVVIDVRLDFDAEVNGEQAVLAFVGPGLAAVLFFDISDDRVAALRILANPDKLRFLGAQLSHPVGLPGS